MMDTPSRARLTGAQLAADSDLLAVGASTKPPTRRLSADATSTLSLEGSTSSSGSMGTTTTIACPAGPADTVPAAAAGTASPHHQTESEFHYVVSNK